MPFTINPSLSFSENLSECLIQCHDLVKLACKYQVSYQNDLAYKHWMSLQSLTLQAFNSFHNHYSSEFLNDNLSQDELHLLNSLKSMKQEAGKRAHKCFEIIIASKMNSLSNPEKKIGDSTSNNDGNNKVNPSISSLGSYSSTSTIRTSITTTSNHTAAHSSFSASKTNSKNYPPTINTSLNNSNGKLKPQVMSPLVSSSNQLQSWSVLDINKSVSLPGTQVTSPLIMKHPTGIIADEVKEEQEQQEQETIANTEREQQKKQQQEHQTDIQEQEQQQQEEKQEERDKQEEYSDKDEGINKDRISTSSSNGNGRTSDHISNTESDMTVKAPSNQSTEHQGEKTDEVNVKNSEVGVGAAQEEEEEADELAELGSSAGGTNTSSVTGAPDVSMFSENNIIEYYNDEDDDDDDDEGYESAMDVKTENRDSGTRGTDSADTSKSNTYKNKGELAPDASNPEEKQRISDILSGLIDDIQQHIDGVGSNEDVTKVQNVVKSDEDENENENDAEDENFKNDKNFTKDIMNYFNNSKDEIDLSIFNGSMNISINSEVNPSEKNKEEDIITKEKKRQKENDGDIAQAEILSEVVSYEDRKTVEEYYEVEGEEESDGEGKEYHAIQIRDFKKTNRREEIGTPKNSDSPIESSSHFAKDEGYKKHLRQEDSSVGDAAAKGSKFMNSLKRFNSEEFGKMKMIIMMNKNDRSISDAENDKINSISELTKEQTSLSTNSNFKNKFVSVFKK